jgi:hypothetical protein
VGVYKWAMGADVLRMTMQIAASGKFRRWDSGILNIATHSPLERFRK